MAAWDEMLYSITLEAGEDLSAHQFRFVDVSTSVARTCISVGSAGSTRTIGVLQNDPDAAGKAATVGVMGVSRVEAGEAIAVGDYIAANADGKALDADTQDQVILGVALEAATATGQIIPVKLGFLGLVP